MRFERFWVKFLEMKIIKNVFAFVIIPYPVHRQKKEKTKCTRTHFYANCERSSCGWRCSQFINVNGNYGVELCVVDESEWKARVAQPFVMCVRAFMNKLESAFRSTQAVAEWYELILIALICLLCGLHVFFALRFACKHRTNHKCIFLIIFRCR